jgi:peptide/nickel transport system ATP-binding protein
MRHGKIVEHGPTEQIFANPRESYTRKLLDAELPIEIRPSTEARSAQTAEVL